MVSLEMLLLCLLWVFLVMHLDAKQNYLFYVDNNYPTSFHESVDLFEQA